MIAIHFEESEDCKQLLSRFKICLNKQERIGLGGKVQSEKDEVIFLSYQNEKVDFFDDFHPLLTSVLTNYIINEKEDEWLLKIIETMFYFTVDEEKQQILTIARMILDGERDDIPFANTFTNRRELIYEKFAKQLSENATVYFDAFLTFRLREYSELLIDSVEMAIDEYMLEQEYQNVVENLRYYLQSTKPKHSCIHIIHDEGYLFYDELLQKLNVEKLLFYLEHKLVFERGIALEDMVLSPLVSLAPRIVHVYSDDPDDHVILSIQAIFQERMKLFPLKDSKHFRNNH